MRQTHRSDRYYGSDVGRERQESRVPEKIVYPVLVGEDMAVADQALRLLKERADGIPSPSTIRRIRTSLGLSQREAGALLRVGPAAFDKYERSLVEPSGPTSQLLKLLDRHPELLADLRGTDGGQV